MAPFERAPGVAGMVEGPGAGERGNLVMGNVESDAVGPGQAGQRPGGLSGLADCA